MGGASDILQFLVPTTCPRMSKEVVVHQLDHDLSLLVWLPAEAGGIQTRHSDWFCEATRPHALVSHDHDWLSRLPFSLLRRGKSLQSGNNKQAGSKTQQNGSIHRRFEDSRSQVPVTQSLIKSSFEPSDDAKLPHQLPAIMSCDC